AWAAGEPSGVPPHEAAERVAIETDAGEVAGWFVPGQGVSEDEPGPGVVFFHGNAELADDQAWIVSVYRPLGVSVMLAEYRGYGGQPGKPSEATITTDTAAWYDLMAARPEVDPHRVAAHGRSIGGAATGRLLTQREPAAVAVESTMTSIAAMVWRFGLPGTIMPSTFRTDRAIAGYDGPVLIMHGRDDELIPFAHGQKLAEIVGDQAEFVAFDATHNTLPSRDEADRYRASVESWLIRAGLMDPAEDRCSSRQARLRPPRATRSTRATAACRGTARPALDAP
ncbi:MAG: alpha/beta hydrolase, partial [Planctomycetota bacterium]